MNPAWLARYDAAIAAAQQAAQLAHRYYDNDVAVEWKKDQSPVTVADREAERLLRTSLLGAFPDDGFLGEEFGDKAGKSGFRWIVDPVDGTRSFVRNTPVWATLVGLEYQNDAIAGVVVAPALGHMWRALRGDGAYRGERRICVSDIDELKNATLLYTNLAWFARAGKSQAFLALAAQTQNQRGYGDFWGHMLVAQGSADLMAEQGVHVWDVAAVKPIVEEAGGKYSDWDGHPNMHRPDVLVSNGKVHELALRILKGTP
jgi:histidinol-phosphatase